MKPAVAALLAASLLSLGACSSEDSDTPPRTDETSTTEAAASPSSTQDAEPVDATEVAEELEEGVKTATKVVTITEDNDPNGLIGRPHGYESAAIIYDSGTSCDMPSTDCGVTVEVFADEAGATARGEHIQDTLEDTPALGSEWDYVKGTTLVRVSGLLKPSVAKEYAEAFGGDQVTAK